MFSQADTRWTCRPGGIFVHYVNELLCMPLLFVSAYNSVLLACPLQTAIPVLFIPVLMLYHNWDLHTLKRISHVEHCHVVTQHCSVSINPKFMWPRLIAFVLLCVFAYRHVLPPVHMLSSHYALCFCLMTQTGMLCEYWWTPKTWGPPSPSITNKSSWPFSVNRDTLDLSVWTVYPQSPELRFVWRKPSVYHVAA